VRKTAPLKMGSPRFPFPIVTRQATKGSGNEYDY
jgi:hypothetical protein